MVSRFLSIFQKEKREKGTKQSVGFDPETINPILFMHHGKYSKYKNNAELVADIREKLKKEQENKKFDSIP